MLDAADAVWFPLKFRFNHPLPCGAEVFVLQSITCSSPRTLVGLRAETAPFRFLMVAYSVWPLRAGHRDWKLQGDALLRKK